MNDALTVLWVLGVGFWLGAKLHQAWAEMPSHTRGDLAALATGGAVNLGACRCQECQSPFWQEQPAEVQ